MYHTSWRKPIHHNARYGIHRVTFENLYFAYFHQLALKNVGEYSNQLIIKRLTTWVILTSGRLISSE